jgi:BCD family chlorophyll transporter-like MFS transporter
VIFSNPWGSAELFFVGAGLIGFGGGLFSVATLTAAMTMPAAGKAGRGLALGAWGAAQATAAGLSIAIGGGIRDVVNGLAANGRAGRGAGQPRDGLFRRLPPRDPASLHDAGGPRAAGTDRNDQSNRATGKIGLADLPT